MTTDITISLSHEPSKHFLLSNIKVSIYEGVTLPSFINDIKTIKINGTITNNLHTFKLNVPAINKVSYFLLDIIVEWNTYALLRIVQAFTLDENGIFSFKYWFPTIKDNKTVNDSDFTVSNLNVHPLLKQNGKLIEANVEFLDITEYWKVRYKNNLYYKIIFNLDSKIEGKFKHSNTHLRVLAYQGGAPFIWFVNIPNYLETKKDVTPLVFFRPKGQTTPDYEPNNLKGIDNEVHEKTAYGLFRYLVKPIQDADITPDVIKFFDGQSELLSSYRNIFSVSGDNAVPNSFAGLEDALFKSNKEAILFLPLKHNKPEYSYKDAVSEKFPELLKNQIKLCWANGFICYKNSENLNIRSNEIVISGYSDSGITLWHTIRNNKNYIKGVILIEPQDLIHASANNPPPKPFGIQQIKNLLKNKNNNVQIVLIGRYKNANYNLGIKETGVTYLPDLANYDNIWKYLPDVKQNTWFEYQALRLIENTNDPFIPNEEKAKIQCKKVANASLLNKIIAQQSSGQNEDGWEEQHGYCHNFALCGGQIFKRSNMNSSKNYWDVSIKTEYKTFFQEALEKII